MEFLNSVGLLLDRSGLGAGDHIMALAFCGFGDLAVHGQSTEAYKAYIKSWSDRAYSVCRGHLGFVPGRIEHSFHGAKQNRKYVERWNILTEHGFDPNTDLHMNRYGIIEVSPNKPEMRRAFEAYFKQRDEDANCLF